MARKRKTDGTHRGRGRPPKKGQVNEAIMKAIKIFGGTIKLAEALDIAPSSVSCWLRNRKSICPERAIQLEKITKGAVMRKELRPDMFL